MAAARLLLAAACLATAACGTAQRTRSGTGLPPDLLAQVRPIGRGPRFHPPLRGPILGRCRPRLGRRFGVHVEVFGANRVVIVPRGIGARPPLRFSAGRISAARCFGALVTLEPTGLVLIRPGKMFSLKDLFRTWGQPLSRRRVAGFSVRPGHQVHVYVSGRLRSGSPGTVSLRRHSEIVLEIGPYIPPHRRYTFPRGS